jgi:hypothetical protein
MFKEPQMVSNPRTGVNLNSPDVRLLSARLGGRIRIVETWFDEDPVALKDVDVWISYRRSEPVSSDGWLYFYTIQIDLTLSPEELLKNMRRSTMKEILAARDKDKLTSLFNTSPSDEDIEAFALHFDENPLIKGQGPVDRNRLLALKKTGLVNLAEVRDSEGTIIVSHFLLCHRRSGIVQPCYQVSLLYRNSTDTNKAHAIGRANRFLYYSEFLFYKAQGFRIYDQNGWYAGLEDEKRLKINMFKEGFGGRILYGYDCEKAVSPLGWIYLMLRAAKRRLFQSEKMKEIRRRRLKAPHLPTAECT